MTSIDEIIQNFEFLEDWEDRYRYLIELGRAMAPLPEAAHTDDNKVRGCASQVWLDTSLTAGPPKVMHFAGDSDAMIVKGLVAVAIALFDGKTPDEVRAIDAEAVFAKLQLREHLTAQRSNGLRALVDRIKSDAEAARNR